MAGIYIITNTINNKVYIGKTKRDIWKRLKMEHETDLVYNRHNNIYLQRAWNKYTPIHGEQCFTFKILEACNNNITIEELNKKEKYWIAKYQSNIKEYGYNLTPGGDGGNPLTEETKQKMRNTIYKKNKDNISWCSSGIKRNRRKISEEQKKKQSETMKNKDLIPWNKGRKMTEEEKQIRKIRMRGRNAWNKGLIKNNSPLIE